MLKEFIAKHREAKAAKLLARLNSPHFDSAEAVLSGERGNVLRKLRKLYVECRRIFMDSAFMESDTHNLARAVHFYFNDPYRPLGSQNAVRAGFPPWATQADLAEALLAEAERRGMLDEVMAEFAVIVNETAQATLDALEAANEAELPDLDFDAQQSGEEVAYVLN